MNLKPLSDHIVVKPITDSATTKSGIVLPQTIEKERPEQGEVLAVGEGRILDNGNRLPVSVKPGQKIIFKKYTLDEIKIDGVEYLILSESEILVILEK